MASDLSASISSVRNELDRLETTISDEIARCDSVRDAIQRAIEAEATLREQLNAELAKRIDSEVKCDDWEIITKISPPSDEMRLEDVQRFVRRIFEEGSEDTEAFFRSCTAFSAEFSVESLEQRKERERERAQATRRELEELERRETTLQQSLARCLARTSQQRRVSERLETANAELRDKIRAKKGSLEQLAKRLLHEQQSHHSSLSDLRNQISCLDPEISQLRVSLCLKNVELADLMERKQRSTPPSINYRPSPSRSGRQEAVLKLWNANIGSQTGPSRPQPARKSALGPPAKSRTLENTSKRSHPDTATVTRTHPSARMPTSGAASPSPSRKVQPKGRTNKKSKNNKSGQGSKSSDDTTEVVEMDMFGGVRH